MAASHGLGLKRPSAIPGFGLALGFTLTYLSLIVLIPLGALVLKSATLGLSGFWEVITGPRTLAALRLSFLTSLFAATVNRGHWERLSERDLDEADKRVKRFYYGTGRRR